MINYIIGHLRGRGRGTIIIINHTVIELTGHTNNHMIKVGVEVLALGDIQTLGRLVVVTGQDVVDVVESSGSVTDLGEVSGPHPAVGVLALLLGVVGGVNTVVDQTVTVLPLLVIVLFEVMVSGVD